MSKAINNRNRRRPQTRRSNAPAAAQAPPAAQHSVHRAPDTLSVLHEELSDALVNHCENIVTQCLKLAGCQYPVSVHKNSLNIRSGNNLTLNLRPDGIISINYKGRYLPGFLVEAGYRQSLRELMDRVSALSPAFAPSY